MKRNVSMSEEKKRRFAVSLAAYNGIAYIAAQIESILSQKNVDLQIFISVDPSSDGTEAFLAKWALSEPRLTLLPLGQRFGGAGPNFYRLLREVDFGGFDYVSFADQDDLWHPEKLLRAHRLIDDQKAAAYSSNFTAFWPSGISRLMNKAWPQRTWDYLFESAGPGCTYVLHSSLALPLQQLVRDADKSLLRVDYHDWLTYAFARFHNFPWIIDDWSSMQYRQHANNQIGVNAGWRSFFMRARKILSGYGFEQSLLIADLIQGSSLPIVRRGLRGGRRGYLWLALRARQCRRRPRDQLLFFISCLLLAIFKPVGRGDA
jgi:rhamnosyltransferase